jgi:hypothetical protein
MRVLKIGALYFAVVFAAGFLLGAIRVVWVVPHVGARVAELAEAPLMLVVSFLVARWLVHRYRTIGTSASWLSVGVVGLVLMLSFEFTAVLWLRGMSIAEYFAHRDPVSGAVYFLSLGVFGILPLLLSLRRRSPVAAADAK